MKTYVIGTSTILLAVGVLGFAFPDTFNIPVPVLLLNLVLGLWGVYNLFWKNK